MKRTRRLSIQIEHHEVEYQEITVYTAAQSATPGADTSAPAATAAPEANLCQGPRLHLAHVAALLGLSADDLRSCLEQGSIHFHPTANSRLLLCRGQHGGTASDPNLRPEKSTERT
jgi:hypothetical protein